MNFFSYSFLWYNHSYTQTCLLVGTVSQVSDVVHGPLVLHKGNGLFIVLRSLTLDLDIRDLSVVCLYKLFM